MTQKAKERHERPVEYRKQLVASRNMSELDRALLKASQRSVGDFKYFCETLLGMRVHSGQEEVIRLMNLKDYGSLAAANGWGKTLFYAMLVMWATYTKQWSPIWWKQYKSVVLGPELAQALITHNEIEQIRTNRHAGQFWRIETGGDGKAHKCLIGDKLIPFTTPNKHVAFQWKHNNAQLFFESAKEKASSIEGWALNLIIFDEVRLELHLKFIVDEVILARGVRAPNMKILLGSTPTMDSFDFFEYFERGVREDKDWWSRTGSVTENIFLDPVQLEKIRQNLDPRTRDQVLSGRFVESPDAYFVRERVLDCMDNAPEPTDMDSFQGRAIPGHLYVGGIDVAVAEGGDYSVITVWDITDGEDGPKCRVVYEKVFQKGTSVTRCIQYADILIEEFACQMAFDGSGPLGVEFGNQASMNAGWYTPIVVTGGHATMSSKSVAKSDLLANFKFMINNKIWSSPNLPGLQKEIISYNIKRDDTLRKDRLMSQCYAAWIGKDYITKSIAGFQFNDMASPYSGEGMQYGMPNTAGMSEGRAKYMQLVEQVKARITAQETVSKLG